MNHRNKINYKSIDYNVWYKNWKKMIQKKLDKSEDQNNILTEKVTEWSIKLRVVKRWTLFFIWTTFVSIATSVAQYYY